MVQPEHEIIPGQRQIVHHEAEQHVEKQAQAEQTDALVLEEAW